MPTFTSLMDFSQSAVFIDRSFSSEILHLLTSICTLFHQFIHCSRSLNVRTSFDPHVINTFPLHRSIPLRLTFLRPQFRFPNRFFYGDRLTACSPTPSLEGQSTVFITSRQGGQAVPSGAGYRFWSPFTTFMGCSGTILFLSHYRGNKADTC
jgi:hypothetical protein